MPENPILQCFVGMNEPRTSHHNGCAKYPASSWGSMPKMRHFETHLWSFIYGAAFWVRLGVKLAFLRGVQKCPELRGKWGFDICDVKSATRSSKSGSSKKGQHLFIGLRPPHFCVFRWRAWIFPKTGFPKSTDLV